MLLPSPSPHIEKWVLKPVVFIACLLPSLLLIAGLLTSRLGFNPVETLTHETGQWALRFLLLTLVITPARALTGMVWLTRFRRMLGLFAFYYTLLHFSIYFLWDQSLNLSRVFEDIALRPYVTLGFAALVLMVPLAITSTNKMRRRLGRRWNRLHKLTYAVAVFGCLHYIWLTKADYLEPAIYLGIFVLLMVPRIRHWLPIEPSRPN